MLVLGLLLSCCASACVLTAVLEVGQGYGIVLILVSRQNRKRKEKKPYYRVRGSSTNEDHVGDEC